MDLNNSAKLLYSNFGNLQKSNSKKLPEVSDYFDSNPATPVKDFPATPVKNIGAPIKDTPMVTVPMNLCDIWKILMLCPPTLRKIRVSSLARARARARVTQKVRMLFIMSKGY